MFSLFYLLGFLFGYSICFYLLNKEIDRLTDRNFELLLELLDLKYFKED